MKIVVLSDSHGNYSNLLSIIKKHQDADYIIHAGDGEQDIETLNMYEPVVVKKLIFIGGNCDIEGFHIRTKIVTFDGVKVFVVHGDQFGVNADKAIIANKAKEEGCQAAIFGHTHIKFCDTVDGIFLLNPGSCDIQGDKTPPSYAIMTVENGIIRAEFYEI